MNNEIEDNIDGLTGYDIIKIPGCPITLPKATSMTQARIDYYHLLPIIRKWYEKFKLNNSLTTPQPIKQTS